MIILASAILIGGASFVNFGNVTEVDAAESGYPSNTGYWVESDNGTKYCEWSFFSTTCRSGAVTPIKDAKSVLTKG